MNREYVGNPLFPTTVDQAGLGNMEGKEVRFGAAVGGLFMAVTTGTSTGAINSWHDSCQPIAGLVPLFNMELGEITPGGIGAGMYGMLIIGAILAVFIAGLMVGRTPEYLGKKVEAFEIKMAMLVAARPRREHPRLHRARLRPAGGHGRAAQRRARTASARSSTPSRARPGNNGSAFAGLTGNTPFYNITGGLAMLIGRYGMIVPILALAGSMAAKRRVAPSLGHVPDHGRAVDRPADRRRDHRRRADVLPGARRWARSSSSCSRTPERSSDEPARLMSVDLGRGTRRFQRFVTLRRREAGRRRAAAAARRPRPRPAPVGAPARLPQARSAAADQEPGHVRRRDHGGARHAHLARRRRPASSRDRRRRHSASSSRSAIWLWFTVLFATYAEAVAEARGRAQAATLRKTRSETTAHRRQADGTLEDVGSSELRKGDIIVVEEGETIPGDGDVIEGVGFVNEAAITGESAPVLKEPGTDIRSSVTGGTTLVSDRLVVRVTADPGETFLDRMIALVEGAKRQRTPNEIALAILLAGLTIVFLMATVTLRPFGAVRRHDRRHRRPRRPARLPHPDDDRRPAVRHRHRRHGPRRPLQRAGHERPRGRGVGRRRRDPARQDRHDHLRQPARRVDHAGRRASPRRRRSRRPWSRRSATRRPEGRSIVELARKRLAELGRPAGVGDDAGFAALAADDRRGDRRSRPRPAPAASGRPTGTTILKGAVDAIDAEASARLPAERRRRGRPDRRRSAPRRSASRATAASSA